MSLHFFDVGANIGQTFDDFLQHRKEFDGCDVWCFEPSPRHLPQLMDKAQAVSSRWKVHVCPFGLRGMTQISTFFMKDDPRGDSFEVNLASDHMTKNIPIGFKLHAFARSVSLFILDTTKEGDEVILKLDAEGSEYHILTHLLKVPEALARIKSILVEFHTIDPDPELMTQDELKRAYAEAGKPLGQWMF